MVTLCLTSIFLLLCGGDPDMNGNTAMYNYVCSNGTPVSGTTTTQDTQKCTACGSGFFLSNQRCTRKLSEPVGAVAVSDQDTISITLLSQTSVYYEFRKNFRIRANGHSFFHSTVILAGGYQTHQEPSIRYITKLLPKNENETGVFALESHEPANNRVCSATDLSLCAPLKVTVTREGYVAFYTQELLDGGSKTIDTYDLKPQNIRVSFTNANTGEKTSQNMTIQPAQKKPPIYYSPYRFKTNPKTGTIVSGQGITTITLLPETSLYYNFGQFFNIRQDGESRFHREIGLNRIEEPSIRYITRLMPKNENDTGVFALEFHEPTNNRVCSATDLSLCNPIKVTVTREGYVAFYTQESLNAGRRKTIYTYDLKPQNIRVSFTNANTGEKTLQDITIQPPQTDCDTTMNSDRYNCLFQKELRADTFPEIITTNAHRSSLPDNMVYDHSKYQLIFNEEFNGNGIASLNNHIWSYPTAPRRSDANGIPCQNVENGHYYFTRVYGCGADLTTEGKFSFKYGYLEVEYTVNKAAYASYINMAMTIGHIYKDIRAHALSNYPGIKIDSIENLLKYVGTEFDLIEYIPNVREQYGHVYIKKILGASRDIKEYSSATWFPFCWTSRGEVDNYTKYRLPACSAHFSNLNAGFIITMAVEWTPAGYRNYMRVHDIHDKLQLISDDRITFRTGDDQVSPGFYYNTVRVGARDLDFNQLGIMHLPAHFAMAAWGYPRQRDNIIKTKMRVNYVRIYQPINHYTNIALVYR